MRYSTIMNRHLPMCSALLFLALSVHALLAVSAAAQGGKLAPEERILFVSDRDQAKQLSVYSMKPDGSDQTRVSKGDAIVFDPAWSPDHKQIVFARVTDTQKRTTSICVMNAAGAEAIVLVPDEEGTVNLAPSWSPDGRHIAYSAIKIGLELASTIYVMDPDGKNRKKVIDGIVPVWSPDSKSLLFSPTPKTDVPELKSVDMDGSNVRTLTEKGVAPAWSPNGKRIVFTGEENKIAALYAMDPDGTHMTRLLQTPDICIGAVWTADGKQILFTRIPKGDGIASVPTLWRMNADGSGAKAITKSSSLLGPGVSMVLVMQALKN